MRRQALPDLHEAFVGRDQRKLRLLDVGCGTGRFLDSIKQVWPRLQITGLDMSDAYIRHAKRHLRRSRTNFIVGKAEEIPLSDNSQDAVTSTFLLHELPPKVRRIALRECTRVLKPGGRLVLLDSLQRGDRPDYEGLLELFPHSYHEPYYSSYIKEDFGSLLQSAVSNSCEARHCSLPKSWFSTNPIGLPRPVLLIKREKRASGS
jgi:ubiquinone/menaquinone biosynthesis C-methylase UbiE